MMASPLYLLLIITNSFNALFSNIGKELAKKITPYNLDFQKYLKDSIPYSIFYQLSHQKKSSQKFP